MSFSVRLYLSDLGVRFFYEVMGIFSFGSLMVLEIGKSEDLGLRCRMPALRIEYWSPGQSVELVGGLLGPLGLPGMQSHGERLRVPGAAKEPIWKLPWERVFLNYSLRMTRKVPRRKMRV